jgi:hypothetical protein
VIFDRILRGKLNFGNDLYEHHVRSTSGSYRKCIVRIGNDKTFSRENLKQVIGIENKELDDYDFRVPYRFCPKVDNSGMAFGVELRVPFLDRRLINFVVHDGLSGGRDLQKKFISTHLPISMWPKKKKGFAISVKNLLNKTLCFELKKIIQNKGRYKKIFSNLGLSFFRFRVIVLINRFLPIYSKDIWFVFILLKWYEARYRSTD